MNIVLLGGNGYIGRSVTRLWRDVDPSAHFYIVSRSGNNDLVSDNLTNLSADASIYDAVIKVLPDKIDYIVDFIGHPEKNPNESYKINNQPAEVMKRIAEEKNVRAMGYIGGLLGPNHFLKTKKDIIKSLSQSTIRHEYVEPTLVYGNDRNDNLSKIVPLLRILGVFSKKMKPINVNSVSEELINKLLDSEKDEYEN
ncbi:hypothetical protein KCA1_0193 [Lactiplantibacillus pentosus KCA1]|nr:NAD-dependent epimerase/dehydratase family protein [Lactiplantibacillus pentosus]EIW15257.1 hypothetical protein KCA1_0193 [Lactiplantibacillus pentosus KCA1]